MISPTYYILSIVSMVCFTVILIGQTTVKPLISVVQNQQKLITECQSKLSRDQFCEIIAIPKVNK